MNSQIHNYLDLFGTQMAQLKACSCLIPIAAFNHKWKNGNNSRRRLRSSDYAELAGHFTCFAEDSKEMYKKLQRIYCFAH